MKPTDSLERMHPPAILFCHLSLAGTTAAKTTLRAASAIAGRQAGRSVGTEPIRRLCQTASPHGPRNEIPRSFLLTRKEEESS